MRSKLPSSYALDLATKLVKFGLVGGSGVLVNEAALYTLFDAAHLPLVVASILAGEIAIANNFVWNDRWTFREHHSSPSRFVRFNLVSLGGIAIATLVLWLVTTFTGIHYLIANLLGIGVATVWNFTLNLVWTWRSR